MKRRQEILDNLSGPVYEFCLRLFELDADLQEFGSTLLPLTSLERSGIRILRQERNRLAAMKEN